MADKVIKVLFTKAPAAMGYAYHPGQEAELNEALAEEFIENGYAERIKPAPAKAKAKPKAK